MNCWIYPVHSLGKQLVVKDESSNKDTDQRSRNTIKHLGYHGNTAVLEFLSVSVAI